VSEAFCVAFAPVKPFASTHDHVGWPIEKSTRREIGVASVRGNDLIHRLDGSVRVTDEGALAVHVSNFDEPWLSGPAVRRSRVLVEHRRHVVDFWAPLLALVRNKSSDRGAHPSGFLGAIGSQLGDPPIFIGVFIVAKLVCRFLRPVAFVLCVTCQADLQRAHIGHALARLRTHREAIDHSEEKSRQNA